MSPQTNFSFYLVLFFYSCVLPHLFLPAGTTPPPSEKAFPSPAIGAHSLTRAQGGRGLLEVRRSERAFESDALRTPLPGLRLVLHDMAAPNMTGPPSCLTVGRRQSQSHPCASVLQMLGDPITFFPSVDLVL
ncbi:hypothetical protein TNCV_683281 [Trichonephila clavipes]|nr:hypothetical protein TNCV_683281 [Trichonephila clavipes]